MTREETIAARMDVHEIQHSMVRLQSQRGHVYADSCGERERGFVWSVEECLLSVWVDGVPDH